MNLVSESEKTKGLDEIKALRLLIQRCSLPIDPSTVEKRPQGQPDLLGKDASGKVIAFEVARLCDPEIAKIMAAGSKAKTEAFWTADPSLAIVIKKLNRSYATEHPIELLLYTDGRIATPDDVIIPTIRPILDSRNGPFRRVWFMGETVASLIWKEN